MSAYGAMGHRIDPSWWSQCSMIGKAITLVCAVLSANLKRSPCNDGSGFPRSPYNSK